MMFSLLMCEMGKQFPVQAGFRSLTSDFTLPSLQSPNALVAVHEKPISGPRFPSRLMPLINKTNQRVSITNAAQHDPAIT